MVAKKRDRKKTMPTSVTEWELKEENGRSQREQKPWQSWEESRIHPDLKICVPQCVKRILNEKASEEYKSILQRSQIHFHEEILY